MTEKNRRWYERNDFKVVGSVEVQGCADPWVTMLREPESPRRRHRRLDAAA